MSKLSCQRKGCTRIRSEFSLFLSRRRPPRLDGRHFCSESCLLAQAEVELKDRWRQLQRDKNRHVPRPRLGTILLDRSFITPDQLDAAVRMQNRTREGKIGEWLLRLGFVEEHQITLALSKQFGLPMIQLKNANASAALARMIPGVMAKCSNLVPVGYGEDNSSMRIAVSGPLHFNSQEAIRRMLHRGVMTYIGDQSAIQALIARTYEPAELDVSAIPTYGSLEDLLEVSRGVLNTSFGQRAANVDFALVEEFFWARSDYENSVQHFFFRYQLPVASAPEWLSEGQWTAAAVAAI